MVLCVAKDGSVKLWERKAALRRKESDKAHDSHSVRSWFGKHSMQQTKSSKRSYSWECTKTFNPKSEAIREVRWSPFHDDSKYDIGLRTLCLVNFTGTLTSPFDLSVFALVTDTGHLIVYNINHTEKPWEKIAAHGAEASTLDWHPTRPYVIATGGVADRSVKSMLEFHALLSLSLERFMCLFLTHRLSTWPLFSLGPRKEGRRL